LSPLIQDSHHIIAFFDGASILKGQKCGAGEYLSFPLKKFVDGSSMEVVAQIQKMSCWGPRGL